jgi:hypothetical protein
MGRANEKIQESFANREIGKRRAFDALEKQTKPAEAERLAERTETEINKNGTQFSAAAKKIVENLKIPGSTL